jgi:DNA-binding MarR family transcriptional regulator
MDTEASDPLAGTDDVGAGDLESSLGELGQELTRAISRIHRRFRSERGYGELGDSAMTVLTVLARTGPQTLKSLSEREHVTPGSMSQTVNRLTDAGYASRSVDPEDGRRVLFAATEHGSALALEAREHRHAWLRARLAERSVDDRRALDRAARIMLEIADS